MVLSRLYQSYQCNVDGQYKYIDFSRGFFYDTITQPMQAVVNSMEENKDKPVIPGLAEGLVRALGRLVEPFVSESIWVGGIMDIWMRGGVTKQGVRDGTIEMMSENSKSNSAFS